MTRAADVIVVGAGPAGAATAILLAEHGLAVTVLERVRGSRPKICGEYLSPEAGRVLDRLGALKAVDAGGAVALAGMRITAPDGTVLAARYGVVGGFRPYREHAIGVSRATLDGALLDRVRALPVDLREGVRVTDVVVEDGRVVGVLGADAGGACVEARARVVVAADGRASAVAHALGCRHPHPLARMALVTYVAGVPDCRDVGEIFVDPPDYAILNPLAPDRVNLSLVVPLAHAVPWCSRLEDFFAARVKHLPHLARRLAEARRVAPLQSMAPLAYRVTLRRAGGGHARGRAARRRRLGGGIGRLRARPARRVRGQGARDARAAGADRPPPPGQPGRPLPGRPAACARRAPRRDRRLRAAARAAPSARVVESRAMASRRSDNLPRRFAKIYTAAITDVMDEMGLLRQTLPHAIQPLTPDMRVAGYAFTARGRTHRGSPRDRDATLRKFLAMLGAVPADSVLVLAANDQEAAHFGELSAEWFRARKVRGAVIDGSTRDAASIARTRFPTFVRYRSPQDSVPRWRVTDWGQPLTVGGVRVSLGDIVVGDLDGVVVVPRRVAHEVLERCERLVSTESKVRTAVKRGMTPLAAYEKFGAF